MATDAIVLLKDEHKEIRKTFRAFEKAGDKAYTTKGRLVDRMIEQLTVHTYLENEVMYPRVAGGRVRDLKRASGRRTLRIAIVGDPTPDWLRSLPEVGFVRTVVNGVELELRPSADPAAILTAVIARGASISRFEVVEPSLEALFIEHVGRPAGDDPTLAPEAKPQTLSPGRA